MWYSISDKYFIFATHTNVATQLAELIGLSRVSQVLRTTLQSATFWAHLIENRRCGSDRHYQKHFCEQSDSITEGSAVIDLLLARNWHAMGES